jgi:hypothetical protein
MSFIKIPSGVIELRAYPGWERSGNALTVVSRNGSPLIEFIGVEWETHDYNLASQMAGFDAMADRKVVTIGYDAETVTQDSLAG